MLRNPMKISDEERWQNWVNRTYRRNQKRLAPDRMFTPPKRCIKEQALSGDFVIMDKAGVVRDGNKVVGRVSKYVMV